MKSSYLSIFEQSRAEQSRAEQSRAEQSRAEQSRAEQSRSTSRLTTWLGGMLFHNCFIALLFTATTLAFADDSNNHIIIEDTPLAVPAASLEEAKTNNMEAAEFLLSHLNKTFFCGPSRDIKTLKAGIEAATSVMDGVLYVDPGTYDLIEEFGQEWFESLKEKNTLTGIALKNRVHVIFSPNSKVISHYKGDNPYAKKLYSPFNGGKYGFTLENLTLECSNCRYGIHDERVGEIEQYKAHYINCSIYHDNHENDIWPNLSCIGGGLGSNAEIIVENCMFRTSSENSHAAVYYHQSADKLNCDYRSIIVVKNCFFYTGTVTLSDARTDCISNNKTIYMVYGNSFLKKYPATNVEGIFDLNLKNPNSELLQWGNIIRTQ